MNIEGLQHTISLEQNIGYYCTLTNILYEASKLCTFVVPRTKYEHYWTSENYIQLTEHILYNVFLWIWICMGVYWWFTYPTQRGLSKSLKNNLKHH